MADEAQKPAEGGEEKSPVFQTGMGAFDRAGFNKSLSEAKGLVVKDEDIEKSKTADKVFNDASEYYKQKYDEAIKKIDPAYDPNSAEAKVGERTYESNKGEIKKNIDEGKSLEGVKDILPLAESAAENRVELTKSLKTGTTTQIAEKVGIRNIKEMDSFEEVNKTFNEATKNENLTLEKSLSSLSTILSFFNNEIRDATVIAKMYTPQNNATISALARILEKEGFSSEIVKTMSKRFEENLAKFVEKESGKIEGVISTTGATGPTEADTGSTTSTTPQKVEEKIEGTKGTTSATPNTEPQKLGEKTETKQIEGTTGAVAATTPQKVEDKSGEKKSVEGAKESVSGKVSEAKEGGASKMDQAEDLFKSLGFNVSGDSNKKETTESSKQELTTKESKEGAEKREGDNKGELKTGATTEKGEQKIAEPKNRGVDFIESMFGGLIGKKEGTLEASKEELKKEAAKSIEAKMESTKTSVAEKIEKKDETISGGGAIKETTSQKLATPSVATSVKTENTTKSEVSSESKVSTPSQEATKASSTGESNTEGYKEATSENKKEGESMSGLEAKMDSMIALLSQLNSTLQGPLLTINSSKKFD